jgi:hypothetical protein
MKDSKTRMPSVLIPYPGADPSGITNDIFIYLRPETNGFHVESTILKVIKSSRVYSENVKLVFLANYPGDYIRSRHIIEHHYSYRINFAKKGKKSFTKKMICEFEAFYNQDFQKAAVISPFDAMKKLDLSEDELFNIWVGEGDFMTLYGNNIKKYKGLYIINYDIPSLLHKNNFQTDIAVMLFRVYFSWAEFAAMISDMSDALKAAGIISEKNLVSRVFHYTKSPFDQIQDGLEYLYKSEGIKDNGISFLCYLDNEGFNPDKILNYLKNPVITIHSPGGDKENSIFEFTKGMNYREASDLLKTAALK